MGFKDLERLIQKHEKQDQLELGLSPAMQRMVNECPKTFYRWIDENHRTLAKPINSRTCCFWHRIGPPLKDGVEMPCLPYQRLLYGLLKKHKKFIVRKARGIGMSTWLLYWLLFKALTEWKPADRACIITGNALRLSEDLISRLKNITQRYFPEVYSELLKQSSTTAIINRVIFEGMPLRFASLRGYEKMRCIISDETDYYPLSQQKQLLDTIIPFENKPNSNSHLILVSTPASAFSIMRKIESSKDSGWYSMILDYTYGLEGPLPIFDKEKLMQTKKSNPEQWSREFECQYLNIGGAAFADAAITKAIELGKRYDPVIVNKEAQHAVGVDPGFGSSSFGVTVLEYSDSIIKVVYCDDFERESFNDMVRKVWEIKNMVGNLSNVYVDMANVEFIEALKQEFGENSNWQYIHDKLAYCKKNKLKVENYMKVVPVSFGIDGATMLVHCKNLIESEDNLIAINPKWTKLIDALRTCTAIEYKVDKQNMMSPDVFDSFRLAARFFTLSK